MSEFAVEGAELKQMIRFARKQPIAFGVNPGKDDKNTLLGMHRIKAAAKIGKTVKKDGEGTKVAFGMCEVQDKILNLRCERSMQGLAKKMKRYLKLNKVLLNVVVLDEDGTVLEEDIEDLPDDPLLDDDDVEQGNDTASSGKTDTVATAVVRQLKDLQEQSKSLPPAAAKEFLTALSAAANAVRSGDLGAAQAVADRVDAALAKRLATPPPDLEPLRQRGQIAQGKIDQIADEATKGKLQAAMALVEKALDAANVANAEKALATIETALKNLPAPEAARQQEAEVTVLADWQAAKDSVDDELRQLSDRLRKSAIPEVQDVADEVETLLAPLRTKLVKALIGVQHEPNEQKARDAALTALADADTWLESDPRVKAIDGNPWGIPVTVAATLGGALKKLQNDVKSLGRAAS